MKPLQQLTLQSGLRRGPGGHLSRRVFFAGFFCPWIVHFNSS